MEDKNKNLNYDFNAKLKELDEIKNKNEQLNNYFSNINYHISEIYKTLKNINISSTAE